MKRHKQLFLSIATFLFTNTIIIAAPLSPVGYWKTIDDVTGKPKSIIKIWETQNHLLMGQVTQIFPSPGKDQTERCIACQGDQHDQPIVGMVILSGLKQANHQWAEGKILDPHNGKTYSCSAKLADNGKKLDVRGYIGLPLLGRSQTWERMTA